MRLRRAANVALGGVPLPVLEKVHPDNIDLAIRAADAFSLNIAGIDLLIADIATSWLESGALICEVNAQPQMSGHLQQHVLSQLVVDQGRIPVDIVLGSPGVAALAEEIAAHERCVTASPWRTGEILVVDNTRFMHGRRLLRPSAARTVVGCFGMRRSTPS